MLETLSGISPFPLTNCEYLQDMAILDPQPFLLSWTAGCNNFFPHIDNRAKVILHLCEVSGCICIQIQQCNEARMGGLWVPWPFRTRHLQHKWMLRWWSLWLSWSTLYVSFLWLSFAARPIICVHKREIIFLHPSLTKEVFCKVKVDLWCTSWFVFWPSWHPWWKPVFGLAPFEKSTI